MSEPILSREEVDALWSELNGEHHWLDVPQKFYERLESRLLEKLRGEPRAWLVEGGKTFVDKAFVHKANADFSINERRDGAYKTPLYTLNGQS
ncbi:hypothetical protein [Burkholderia ubonensis]|uniref:hypothetical protein n=1 Tax=Burkholderia ubonensis TaxID=101571 RepID=UPI00075C775B|nr:hypothetical protein [Burkholderia ubonensis]KWK75748.1 hypothetical protein WM15_29565 [Burkholderia ubonensis]